MVNPFSRSILKNAHPTLVLHSPVISVSPLIRLADCSLSNPDQVQKLQMESSSQLPTAPRASNLPQRARPSLWPDETSTRPTAKKHLRSQKLPTAKVPRTAQWTSRISRPPPKSQ